MASTALQSTAIGIPILNTRAEWSLWKFVITKRFKSEGLMSTVNGDLPCPIENQKKMDEWEAKDSKAFDLLLRSMSTSTETMAQIQGCETSHEAWKMLSQVFEFVDEDKQNRCNQESFDFKCTDNMSISDYLVKVRRLAANCRETGAPLREAAIVSKITNSLPGKFEPAILSFEGREKGQRTLETLTSLLMRGKKPMVKGAEVVNTGQVSTALIHGVRQSGDPPGKFRKTCFKCGKRGHRASVCKQRANMMSQGGNNQSTRDNNARYAQNGARSAYGDRHNQYNDNTNYNARNNYGRDTRYDRSQESRNNYGRDTRYDRGQESNNNYRRDAQGKVSLLSSTIQGATGRIEALSTAEKFDRHNEWVGDSGAGEHMTPRRDWFVDYAPLRLGESKIVFGDDTTADAVGIGEIKIVTRQGETCIMQNVLHVPTLKKNLFSLSKLSTAGFTVTTIYTNLTVSRDSTVITGTLVERGIYRMHMNTASITTAHSSEIANENLWHRRLGHANVETVRAAAATGLIDKQSRRREDAGCRACIEGKMTRASFPTSDERATKPAELMHVDLCGPMQVESLGGARYLCLYVDDYTAMLFAYSIKNKSEFINTLKDLLIRTKNRQLEIRRLRSDNACGLVSAEVERFLADNAIGHKLSAPYCPEQNGRIERQNRTVIEMARTMRLDAGLPVELWAELCAAAAQIRNVLPLARLSNISPYEAWTGTKPKLDILRVIGSDAYVHISHQFRKKFDAKAERCILVGYEFASKSYRVWRPGTNRIFVARSVQVIETDGNAVRTLLDNKCAHDGRNENAGVEWTCLPRNEGERTVEVDIRNDTSEPTSEINNINPQAKRGRGRPRKSPVNTACSLTGYIPCLSIATHTLPETYQETVDCEQSWEWRKAMDEEINSILKSNVWELVDRSSCNKKPLQARWVYRVKLTQFGEIERYKARLVVKGFAQRRHVDYEETYSPVAKQETIRALLAVVAKQGLKIT